MYKLGVISQERLKIEVKSLLSANMKSYMPRRLAQQRMTLSDRERPFHGSASRAISAVSKPLVFCLLICLSTKYTVYMHRYKSACEKLIGFSFFK